LTCLDTTFLADLLRRNSDAESKLSNFVKQNISLTTTIINSVELFYGAYKLGNFQEEKHRIKRFLQMFAILEMDEQGAEKFGEIMNFLDKKGQKVADRDVLIAAIAISKGETTIVTRNRKDFERIPGLFVETY
jgi:predicted nucleic acid-binding protein